MHVSNCIRDVARRARGHRPLARLTFAELTEPRLVPTRTRLLMHLMSLDDLIINIVYCVIRMIVV